MHPPLVHELGVAVVALRGSLVASICDTVGREKRLSSFHFRWQQQDNYRWDLLIVLARGIGKSIPASLDMKRTTFLLKGEVDTT